MANVANSEAKRRRQQDDGDPEDTVHRVKGKRRVAYHADPECQRLHQSHVESVEALSRGAAKAAGNFPCGECVLGTDRQWAEMSPAQALRHGYADDVASALAVARGDEPAAHTDK